MLSDSEVKYGGRGVLKFSAGPIRRRVYRAPRFSFRLFPFLLVARKPYDSIYFSQRNPVGSFGSGLFPNRLGGRNGLSKGSDVFVDADDHSLPFAAFFNDEPFIICSHTLENLPQLRARS
jgi:hypothetical protein